MFESMYFYLMIVVIVFALGDIVGHFTKGKLSAMMIVMLLFLVGFLTGVFPSAIIAQAGLTQLVNLAIAMVLFNMGTTINIRQLIREWRTVCMAALCMVASCVLMLAAIPLIGSDTVLIGMPAINGAAMATSLMTAAATEKGLTTAAALCAVIYSVQKLVGAPIASAMGLKYARKLVADFRTDPEAKMAAFQAKQTGITSDKVPFYEKHKELYTANINIAIVCIGAWLARCLGDLTPVNYAIWALLLGSFSGIGGYVPPKPLQRSNSYGLLMIAIFGSIIPSLAAVSLSDLGTMAIQTIILFALAVLGIFIVSYLLPIGKWLVGDKDLAMGIGVEQFLGFPSNVVICREVAEAVGETPDEKTYIEDTLNVPYVVGGITVVTILSVLLAGFVISLL
ncbi:MAG: hypothetical protein LIO96_01240 [Lachnospiraceae bacterium]|nr:hypothetical protein [Lachnospiraceae bacterium]